ncbi:hypothetical protein [Pseudomonas sp. FG-3G]|nr:hypothetical protein [Pseudomonas sp. FG-3G]
MTLLGLHNPCGSEPARDSGVSVDGMQAEPTLSRAGSLPQVRYRISLIGINPQSEAAG